MSGDAGLFDVPGAPTTGGPGAGSLGVNTHASAPLPVRMRPRTLDELEPGHVRMLQRLVPRD